jgi:tetratricopeptide (TPR) repeat protein
MRSSLKVSWLQPLQLVFYLPLTSQGHNLAETTAPADRWFIDVRGQIRPISSYQILQGLLDGNLKVIFRISRDRESWAAICNETYFDTYIEQVIKALMDEVTRFGVEKAQQSNTNMEQSGFHNLSNLKSNINEQLAHAGKLQELNVTLHSLRRLTAEIVAKRKLVIDVSETHQKDELHPDDQNEIIDSSKSWTKFLERFRWNGYNVKARIAIPLFVLALITLVTTKYYEHQREKAAAEAVEKARAVVQAQIAGEYEKAMTLYSSMPDHESTDTKTLLAVAQSQIATKKMEDGAETLKRILHISTDVDERARAQSLLGLIAMKSNDLNAANAFYLDSLKTKTLYSSLYNLATIHIKKNNPAEAEPLLLQALQIQGHDKGPVVLELFETAWQLDLQDLKSLKPGEAPKYIRLDKVKAILDQTNDPNSDYADQMLAAQITLLSVENKSEEFNFLVKDWVMRDPRRTAKTPKYESDINYEFATWAHIYNWCIEVYKNPNLGSLKSAFFAGCIARADAPSKALPYAQYAFENSPADLSLRSFLGLLDFLSDNLVTAKKVLRGGDYDSSPLAQKTLAEICAKMPDSDCGKPSKPAEVATKIQPPQRKPTQRVPH